MNLTEFIKPGHIHIGYTAESKDAFFNNAVEDLGRDNDRFVPSEMLALFKKRESTMSTGIGNGIAIPHIAYEACAKLQIHIFKLSDAIDFKSLDKKPVQIIFLLVASAGQSAMMHLQTLAKLGRLIKNREFLSGLREAQDEKQIHEVFKLYE